ncbi:MAG: 50S ribosomal protein L6 [Rhodobacteraceae bacterium]|nr:50S ribosomal protein L6 [Paracoccaceae bacterium]
MSRIGKKPVELPSGVSASVSGQTIEIKGPKGTRSFTATDDVTITLEDNVVTVTPRGKSKRARQQWGMSRTMVANCVKGVIDGFKKELEINGVGYRAQLQGNVLKLNLGLSHDVNFDIPSDVTVQSPKQTEITIEGIDSQRVGQVAANIREWRKPEPYKGKGIMYKGEYIFRKEGNKLRSVNAGRVRLSVHRSNKNISAQLIDDAQGVTLASASSLESSLGVVGKNNIEASAKVGAALAERAKKAGVEECYFDRGGFLFHGGVKALADAAREGGLKF